MAGFSVTNRYPDAAALNSLSMNASVRNTGIVGMAK